MLSVEAAAARSCADSCCCCCCPVDSPRTTQEAGGDEEDGEVAIAAAANMQRRDDQEEEFDACDLFLLDARLHRGWLSFRHLFLVNPGNRWCSMSVDNEDVLISLGSI